MFCDPYLPALAKRAELAALGQLLFLRSVQAMGPRKTSEAAAFGTYLTFRENPAIGAIKIVNT